MSHPDRRFRVYLNGKPSRWRKSNNGLPQGAVISPSLFNIYINDLPPTQSEKLIYADDITLVAKGTTFEMLEKTLTEDLQKIEQYCTEWMLRPNPSKTVVTTFHLDNNRANKQLNVTFCGNKVVYEPTPKYLGVTLDRSLTFCKHLENVRDKTKSRIGHLNKLAGTTWGAGANTLRITALALIYSIAEYCTPVWINSNHTKKIDTALNIAMRIVTGTLNSTKLEWLPTLSNIAPPQIRREDSTAKYFHRLISEPALQRTRSFLENPPRRRLKSRYPPWERAEAMASLPSTAERWEKSWSDANIPNKHLIEHPDVKVQGFDLPRAHWCTINRIRMGQGRSAQLMHHWNLQSSSSCDCDGQTVPSIQHIVEECPKRRFPEGLMELHRLKDDKAR